MLRAMPPQQGLNEALDVRHGVVSASARLLSKDATGDCGCGCGGDGEKTVNGKGQPPVVIPGLVHSGPRSLSAKALAHVIALGEGLPLVPHGSALLPVSGTKVGSFGSHDRVMQAVQAVASAVTPGDMSDIRSPIRSTVYEAITPGGGGRRNRLQSIGRSLVRRCPPGYEHGGRFANATMSNCGSLLFDLANGPGNNLVGAATGRQTVGGVAVGRATIRGVGAGLYGDSGIMRRDPNIPPVGKANNSKRDSAIEEAVVAAGSSKDGFMRFVRKDGVAVKPIANMAKLLKQRNHPEMVGSTLIVSANKPNGIGGEEVKLLGNGVGEITYAIPGGHTFTLRPKKTITPRRAAALHRQLLSLREEGDDHGRALKMLAEKNPSDITVVAKFKALDDANDMVIMERNGQRRVVQKWAFLTWYAANSPARVRTSAPWRLVTERA